MIRPKEGAEPFNPNIGGSVDFYKRCLNNELKTSDFRQAEDGAPPLKMAVLPELMRLTYSGSLMGDFNFTKPRLVTEKIIGNLRGCMGFVKDTKIKEYSVPNTILQDDIRDITYKSNGIVAIFEKSKTEVKYGLLYIKTDKATRKKNKKTGEIQVIPPVDHHDAILNLEIVKNKANYTI